MTYEEALTAVNSLLRFGMKPGLERIEKLLARLGNPQDGLKFVHVAGTNGKGTTCVLTAGALRAAGYRTGLYTSPYVCDFRERMQIDGEMISQNELVALVEEIYPIVKDMEANGEVITEFEFITAMAFLWYARRECQVVVLEVGLGGRFDATNVIKSSELSVICSISLDHTAILGDTVEQISFEKSGIMKQGGTCVCYADQSRRALNVLKTTAEVTKNRFVMANLNDLNLLDESLSGSQFLWHNIPVRIPFLGRHQIKNASTALAVVEELRRKGWSIPDEAIQKGFESAVLPARLEVLSLKPVVILDGGHNPEGTEALSVALRKHLRKVPLYAVMGMMADKDVKAAVENLLGQFKKVYTLTPSNPRAMPAEELAALWKSERTEAQAMDDVDACLSAALADAGDEGGVVICGSFYLAGDVRPKLLEHLRRRS